MIWDAIYMALNSTIGGTLEPLDVMVKRLKNELNTAITTLQTTVNNNHAGYKALFEEYETPGKYHINVPYGAKKVKVTANAGGGGMGYNSTFGARNGGNGASVTGHEYSVASISHFILTVGKGGTTNREYGSDGGSTILEGIVTLTGGKGATPSGRGDDGTGGDGATPQNSLNKQNRGTGGANNTYPDGTYSSVNGAGWDGWCRLEWVF